MSCYSCLTKFSLFTKEHSCPNCGFSFCSKCLKQKASLGDVEKNVCLNCFKKLTSDPDKTISTNFATPDLLLKRLETLENPAKPPITIFRHSARLTNLKVGLSSEDKKILERLEKLKADHTASNLPDENEIKRRLALLQDKSIESMSTTEKLESTPKLAAEEVEELLNQYMEETGIDTSLETEAKTNLEDIQERLRKLQASESSTMMMDTGNEELGDEDLETVKIIKRVIAEANLEKKLKASKGEDSDISDMDDSEPEPEPESSWCIICNEDAVLKCMGCNGDLYCNSCFQQGHEYFNMDDHKFFPYTKKEESLSDS